MLKRNMPPASLAGSGRVFKSGAGGSVDRHCADCINVKMRKYRRGFMAVA